MVHAACLDPPDGNGRIIIHAPSGTGKTTTAMALSDLGYRLCSDDMTVLAPRSGNTVLASGIPRAFKVHQKTVEAIGWLAGLADPRRMGRQRRTVDHPQSGIRPRIAWRYPSEAAAKRGCVAADRQPPGGTHVLNGADALMELMADNISLGAGRALSGA